MTPIQDKIMKQLHARCLYMLRLAKRAVKDSSRWISPSPYGLGIEATIARIRYAWFRIRFSHAHEIFTHLTDPEKYLLYKLAKSLPKNSVCVEIGAYLGASSCFIASGLDDSSRLFSIDTWQNDAMISTEDEATDPNLVPQDTFERFLDNVYYLGSKVTPLRGWSTEMVYHLKSYQKIGFLFIDGDHSYESVKADWHAYAPLLGENSIVAFHDTGWAQGVNQIIEEEVFKIAERIHQLPNLEIYRISQRSFNE